MTVLKLNQLTKDPQYSYLRGRGISFYRESHEIIALLADTVCLFLNANSGLLYILIILE